MAKRGASDGPFFKLTNGQPLTKPYFTRRVRENLRAIGLPEFDFAGHSFQIGAATATANDGIEDSTIRALGRWSSSAFLAYIHTPKDQLAQFSRALLLQRNT